MIRAERTRGVEPKASPAWRISASVIVCVLLFMIVPAQYAQAANPVDHVVVEDDILKRIDPQTDESMWEIHHPSVWKTEKKEKKVGDIVGPVTLAGRTYYGVRGWLLELDVEQGVIRDREAVPARIVGLEPDGDLLKITVEYQRGGYGEAATDDIGYRPGGPTPPEVWRMMEWLAVWKDASYLAPGISVDGYEFEDSEREHAIDILRQHRRQEPGNPFYDFFLGKLLPEAEPNAAFERAAGTDDAHWFVDITLAAFLDDVGRHDLADEVFARAKEKVSEQAPSFRRTLPLITYAMSLGWSRERTAEAIESSDYETADRILSRTAWLYPHLEGSAQAWKIVADWHAANGRKELSKAWRQRQERAQDSLFALGDKTRRFDLMLTLLIASGLAVWLASLVIGIRSVRPGANPSWAPRPGISELVGLVVVSMAAIPIYVMMSTAVFWVGTLMEAPPGISASWGNPGVETWIDELTPSDAREPLLDYARRAQSAYDRGERPSGPPPSDEVLRSAIDAHADNQSWDSMNSQLSSLGWIGGFLSPVILLPGWVIAIVLFLFLGGIISAKFPRVGRLLRWTIPGGARPASFLTPFIATAALAAVSALLFETDTIMHNITTPYFSKFFGLESLYTPEDFTPSRAWAWASLGVVVVLHVMTVFWELRTSDA